MKYSLPRKPKFAYVDQYTIRYPVDSPPRSIGIKLVLNTGTTEYFHNEKDAQLFADNHGWQIVPTPKNTQEKIKFYKQENKS